MTTRSQPQTGTFPIHFWFGLLLIAITWPLNWLLPGLRTHLLFFPLWLGYALTVDAIVFRRKGTSLLTRNWLAYVGLFFISAPAWWLFEAINLRTQNWVYDGRQEFTMLQYALLASLAFSTVIPAVFGTAELVSTFSWLRWLKKGPVIKPTRIVTLIYFILGWMMLVLMLIKPRYFFPFIWLSLYFIIEPVNVWLGNGSLLDYVKYGDWRPVLALWLGTLICGFFWEFWNFYAYPKWLYNVPFFDFLRIFEMPLLGYGGYLPFGMELYALYHLVIGLTRADLSKYIHLGR